MPRTESTIPGADVQHNQERTSSGLLTQNGAGTLSTPAFSADDDQQYGALQVWRVKAKATADQAYDAAAAITNVFGSTKVARNEKYRIVGVRTSLRSLRTGGSPDHDLKVQKGDGAASESFSDVVASVDVDSDTVDLPTERILVAAQTLLSTGETLRVQFSVAGTTTTGTAECDFDILAIPCKA